MTEQDHKEKTDPEETSKKWMAVLILTIAILSFAFYWFEIRDVRIRRDCWATTVHSYMETRPGFRKLEDLNVAGRETLIFIYSFCVDVGGADQVREIIRAGLEK